MGYGLWVMGYGLWVMGYGDMITLACRLLPIAHYYLNTFHTNMGSGEFPFTCRMAR